MSNIDKQALTDKAISKAFAGTNFGRDDFKNILAETVIDAAAGWRCGYTATTICTQLGLLTPKGCASALGLRFISEHVQRETKRLKDELEAKETESEWMRKRIEELAKAWEVSDEQRVNWFQMAQKLGEDLEAAEKRIAELEVREVTPEVGVMNIGNPYCEDRLVAWTMAGKSLPPGIYYLEAVRTGSLGAED